MALKIGPLPYGGGGLPKTRKIAGRTFHLFNWGPYKPPRRHIEWAKEQTGARYARCVKIHKFWVTYVAE